LLWKVYNIESGKIMKAGFESEEDAKEWLEARYEDLADEYMIEETVLADDEDDAFYDEEDEEDDDESDEESLEDMYEDEDDED
jgi:hypothetical protein